MKADFDIGNLVYVVLTIVFLVIGALGKKKKPPLVAPSEANDPATDGDVIKTQIQEFFRDLNPTPEIYREPEYVTNLPLSEEVHSDLDTIPDGPPESLIDVVPEYVQPIDSNINYNDQAQSSLDTVGMEEGLPDFDYQMDHHSLVYNDLTKEYNSVPTDYEEELAGIIDEFDPKTAFVYSEIFKRKEF